MLREKAKASKRRAILEAAAKQLAQRPYHEVLLEDIAAEAEVAKGTLYLYFENKADLYLALIAETLTPLLARLEEQVPLAAEKSAWAAIHLLLREMLLFKTEHPALNEVLRETSIAAREAACGDLKAKLRALILQTLKQGVARGELLDPAPEVTTELILTSTSAVSHRMTGRGAECGEYPGKNDGGPHERWSADQAAEYLLQVLGKGLLAGAK